jgi:hypothetical protein
VIGILLRLTLVYGLLPPEGSVAELSGDRMQSYIRPLRWSCSLRARMEFARRVPIACWA